MASSTLPTLSISSSDRALKLITASFPSLPATLEHSTDESSHLKLPDSSSSSSSSSTFTSTNSIASYLAPHVFPSVEYSTQETAQIDEWLSTTTSDKLETSLPTINENLKDKTTLLGSKLSIADIVVYARVAEIAKKWSVEERTGGESGGLRYLLRWIDYVQNTPALNLKISDADKVPVDHSAVGTVVRGQELKKEKAAAGDAAAAVAGGKSKGKGKADVEVPGESALDKVTGAVEAVKEKIVVAGTGVLPEAVTGKKQKKEKAPKAPAPKKEETPLSPSLIDLRVGFIEKCVPHENADSLFVSTIHCGDPEGPRTVCSGLNGLIPIEEMQERLVVVVCNLKPVTMRGVKSAAMVLAASPRLKEGEEDNHKGPVELVSPPVGSKAGEKVFFEGYDGQSEGQLNPKKKIWESIQPGFTTTDGLNVGFDAVAAGLEGAGVKKLVTASGGLCTVPSLKGAIVR